MLAEETLNDLEINQGKSYCGQNAKKLMIYIFTKNEILFPFSSNIMLIDGLMELQDPYCNEIPHQTTRFV